MIPVLSVHVRMPAPRKRCGKNGTGTGRGGQAEEIIKQKTCLKAINSVFLQAVKTIREAACIHSPDRQHAVLPRRAGGAFVRRYVPSEQHDNADAVISTINGFGLGEMWEDLSPIWYRPQYHAGRMYKSRELLQVVGHTPVEAIVKSGSLISCDVFSTYRDGTPIGTQEFLIIDTVTWDCSGIRA